MKRRDLSSKADKVSSLCPSEPPTPDRKATARVPSKDPARDPGTGRFAKRKPGGQPGNQGRTTHGCRKGRTKRGAVKIADKFVRRGQDAASGFWRDTNCHPKDARRRTLATYEAEIARCRDQMGPDYKPHNRDLTASASSFATRCLIATFFNIRDAASFAVFSE